MTVPVPGGAGRTPVPWDGPEPYAPVGVPLVDLLDRVLATGVVVSGDLVRISLHALLASVSDRVPAPWPDSGPL